MKEGWREGEGRGDREGAMFMCPQQTRTLLQGSTLCTVFCKQTSTVYTTCMYMSPTQTYTAHSVSIRYIHM